MSAQPIRANAHRLPLADESVDLIITSPPYYALRSYRDGGDHYDGQVGSEPTPQAFLEALWTVTAECWRVLKPTGSLFVNLGDKRAGSGGHNNSGISAKSTLRGNGHVGGVGAAGPTKIKATLRNAPDRYNQAAFGRPKSKMLLPHRFAIGCEDGLADPCTKDHAHVGRHPAYLPHEQCQGKGWVMRSDMVWSKPNGLPESVTDRVRDSHEYWFHLTKSGRYFSAVDEIREAQQEPHRNGRDSGPGSAKKGSDGVSREQSWVVSERTYNPLGKLPGSVWTIASEPLTLPAAVKEHYDLPDHFAAFPQEWPRRLILGWSPSGVCVACGEGRRPVVAKELRLEDRGDIGSRGERRFIEGLEASIRTRPVDAYGSTEATITGHACACPDTSAPTRPSVVIDPFGGTGTVAGVARQLGRLGLSFDLSHDYSRLAAWFLRDGRRFAKSASRTDRERQGAML